MEIETTVGRHLKKRVLRGKSVWGSIAGEITEEVEDARIVTSDGREVGRITVVFVEPKLTPQVPGSNAIQPPSPVANMTRHFLTDEQRRTIETHAAFCALCEHFKRLTERTVHCRQCNCAGLSLLHGTCPLGKWSEHETALAR